MDVAVQCVVVIISVLQTGSHSCHFRLRRQVFFINFGTEPLWVENVPLASRFTQKKKKNTCSAQAGGAES